MLLESSLAVTAERGVRSIRLLAAKRSAKSRVRADFSARGKLGRRPEFVAVLATRIAWHTARSGREGQYVA